MIPRDLIHDIFIAIQKSLIHSIGVGSGFVEISFPEHILQDRIYELGATLQTKYQDTIAVHYKYGDLITKPNLKLTPLILCIVEPGSIDWNSSTKKIVKFHPRTPKETIRFLERRKR